MISAIIFDLYGTLIHFTHDTRPFTQLLNANPQARRKQFIRLAFTWQCNSLQDFANKAYLNVPDNIDELEIQLQQSIDGVELYPDVMDTLGRLQRRHIKTAVISNLASPYRQPVYTHALDNYIDEIIFSCECGLAKPDPAIYHLALEKLAVPAKNVLMIGDSRKCDVDGPKQVGIQSLLLLRNQHIEAQPNEIHSLTEIIDRTPSGG